MTTRSLPERGALALWIGLFAVACLRAALALAPGMWGWGLNLLRFVPRGPGWTLWALSTLLLVPALARPVAGALERVTSVPRLRVPLALVWVAGVAVLAWWLPDRVAFTGDFLLRQGAALEPLPPRHLFPQALPLDVALHYSLLRAMVAAGVGAGVASTEVAARLLGSIEAAALAALALAFARVLGLRGVAALAAAAIVCFGGWLGLFTGYSKAFSEMVVLVVAIGVLALRARPSGAGLTLLGLALALALALHRSALALLPAAVLALVMGARARARAMPGARSPGVLAAFAAPIVVLAVLLPRLVATLTGFDRLHHLASPEVAQGGGVLGAAFAPMHLLDLANLVALLSPAALVLPLVLGVARAEILRGREAALLLTLAVPQLLLMLFVHPSQGLFRDWDVFAPAVAALALLAALAVGRIVSASPAHRWLGVSVAAAVAAPAALWLLHSADLDRGLERAAAFASEAPPRSEDQRGLIWEYVGTCANVHGRTGLAADAMARAATLTPSARVLLEWGMAEAARGEYGVARGALERAAGRDSTQRRVWLNLVHTCLQLDDLAGARRAAVELVRRMPGDAPSRQLLAEIERMEAARHHEGRR